MDYRNFLQNTAEEYRLPYFGNGSVCDGKRTWKIRDDSLRPGWYRFRPSGRALDAIESIAPEAFEWESRGIKGPNPGYHAIGRFVGDTRQAHLYDLPEDEDLERFTPVTAWEWFDGNLLLGAIEFETDAETAVREAYEDETSIEAIKAVTPALANAFILETTARELGREAVRRREETRLLREQDAKNRANQARITAAENSIEGRIAIALSHSGAELIDWRRNGGGTVAVRYRVGGQRIECIIDSNTLSIVDSGICLDGTDGELNLTSLPSAVQEAIDTGQLHVYRRG
ncbi:MAG: hypothetical protein P1V20_12620 [Verrucomicrobiales bacterium]|nr:hypothetical protein [Verrucomicrobiales bacterium]